MDVEPAFVADAQASHSRKPGQGALDNPTVSAQSFATFNTPAGNARLDTTLAASPAAAPVVVSLVGVQLARSLARLAKPAFNSHHRIEQFSQRHAVMYVSARQDKCQRQTVPSSQQVALCARFAAVRRIRARGRTPFLPEWTRCPFRLCSSRCTLPSAGAAAAPDADGSKPRLLASCAVASNTSRQSRSPSPAAVSPRECLRRSTKRIPVSAARSGTRGRPPLGLGRSTGSSGSTMDQSSSLTIAFVMPSTKGAPTSF